jgi:hypothetical protein
LLTEGEVFENEILSRIESTDNPAQKMPEVDSHGKNLIGMSQIELVVKLLILRVFDLLANHRLSLPDSNLFSIASMVWSIGTFHFVNDFSRQMTIEEARLRFQRFPGFRQVEQIPEGVRQSVKDH